MDFSFDKVKNKWLQENLRVLPLILSISLFVVALYGIFAVMIYERPDLDWHLLISFFSYYTTGALGGINGIFIVSRTAYYNHLSKSKRNFARYIAMLLGIVIGTMIGHLSHYGCDEAYWESGIKAFYYITYEVFYGASIATPLFIIYIRKEYAEQQLREREVRLLQSEKLKTKAELEALQAKINPHFLYNSLNSIATLIRSDNEKAEKMVIDLSKFLRYSLNLHEAFYASVNEEIEIVQTYLEIEKIRFSDRLSINIDVDPEVEYYLIPRFLLQPLVENAIKHGISKNVTMGIITIQIKKNLDGIEIIVHDNGPDFPEDFISGYGLKGIYDRLHILLENEHSIHIENGKSKSIKIKIDKRVNYAKAL